MTDAIEIETDDVEQDMETLLAALSTLQDTALQFGDVGTANDAGHMGERLIRQNPDTAAETIKRLVRKQQATLMLPNELADVMDMDPEEWGIFYDPEEQDEDMVDIDVE